MILLSGKINSFSVDTPLFEKGDEVEYIVYIQKGSILKDTGVKTYTINEGNFICYDDVYSGFYSCDYTATKGTEILPIPAASTLELMQVLSNNPEWHKGISHTVCCLHKGLHDMYVNLYNIVKDFYTDLQDAYGTYVCLCDKHGITAKDFALPHDIAAHEISVQAFGKNLLVLKSLADEPEKEKALATSSGAKYLKLQIDIINRVYVAYDNMFYFLKNLVEMFASERSDCLFALVSDISSATDDLLLQDLLMQMNDAIHSIDERVKEELNYDLDIDYNRVNFFFMVSEHSNAQNTYIDENDSSLIISESEEDSDSEDFVDCDLYDILLQLCNYAEYPKDKYDILNKYMLTFINMPDKYSKETDARIFRKSLIEVYYQLYEDVFLKYASSGVKNILVKLFLDYGLMDERLVTDIQIQELLNLAPIHKDAHCKVYRMSDWLMKIYKGEAIPSKNEFDQEYSDYVREKKKNEALSPAEERKLLEDNTLKVKYEIQNMLKYNCRLLNGNLLAFYPMLHIDAFEKNIEALVVTSEAIADAVNTWKQYDYSIFYREMMYSNPENKIDKEVIQKEIYPIFILFPVVGVNGVMWQDISGKRSNSNGRFFLPALFDGNLPDTMLTLLGRFRWELCKTLQGVSWNNIQVPSLTSEFIDYIQFYKKNKELTADKKDAIKTQLSKCHNNMRDFFVYDYTIWLKYEATGAMRLNKFSRKMLATYCPLSLAYREKLAAQPIYEEAMKRFNLNRLKKLKEYQTKITYYQKKCDILPKEITDTKTFYEM